MPKLDLTAAKRIKMSAGEILALKGPGYSWVKPSAYGPSDLEYYETAPLSEWPGFVSALAAHAPHLWDFQNPTVTYAFDRFASGSTATLVETVANAGTNGSSLATDLSRTEVGVNDYAPILDPPYGIQTRYVGNGFGDGLRINDASKPDLVDKRLIALVQPINVSNRNLISGLPGALRISATGFNVITAAETITFLSTVPARFGVFEFSIRSASEQAPNGGVTVRQNATEFTATFANRVDSGAVVINKVFAENSDRSAGYRATIMFTVPNSFSAARLAIVRRMLGLKRDAMNTALGV